jgi:hypothetical protein
MCPVSRPSDVRWPQLGFTVHGSTTRGSAEHRFFAWSLICHVAMAFTTGTNPNLWPRFAPPRRGRGFF